jgi:hypothetical protein
MLENNELEEAKNKYILKKEMTFNLPSSAVDFIFGGSNNCWDYLKDEDDNVINKNLQKLFE